MSLFGFTRTLAQRINGERDTKNLEKCIIAECVKELEYLLKKKKKFYFSIYLRDKVNGTVLKISLFFFAFCTLKKCVDVKILMPATTSEVIAFIGLYSKRRFFFVWMTLSAMKR